MKAKGLVILSILLFTGAVLPVSGGTISEPDLIRAVETWVHSIAGNARPQARVERLEPYVTDTGTLVYIAHLNDSGFCICVADTFLYPVYMYFPHSFYHTLIDSYPDAECFLRGTMTRLASSAESIRVWRSRNDSMWIKYKAEFNRRREIWNYLIRGEVPPTIWGTRTTDIEPDSVVLLGAELPWNQSGVFNTHLPPFPDFDPDGAEEVPTGCCPLAMAIVTTYWRYPNAGYSSPRTNSYTYRYSEDWISFPLSCEPNIPDNFYGEFKGVRLDYDNVHHLLKMKNFWGYDHGLPPDEARGLIKAAKDKVCDSIPCEEECREAMDSLYFRLTEHTVTITDNCAHSINWEHIHKTSHEYVTFEDSLEIGKLTLLYGVRLKAGWGITSTGVGYDEAIFGAETTFQCMKYWDDAYGHHLCEGCPSDDASLTNEQAKMKEEIQYLRPIYIGSAVCNHCFVLYGYKNTSPLQFKFNMGWGWSLWWGTIDDIPRCDYFTCDTVGVTYDVAPQTVRFIGAEVYCRGADPGSPDDPYYNIEQMVADSSEFRAAGNYTVIIRAGEISTFSSDSVVVNFPVTLKSWHAVIRHE